MIFVTLGTQDKGFPRLLDAIEKQIKKGNIKEEVIVQAGLTEYKSKNMKIFDLVPKEDFDKYVDEADLIISHGGAGSILTAVTKGKKVIAAARLSKYKEHNNDHQLQIVKEFSDKGYILALDDFDELDKVLKKSKTFKPKKYISNTKNIEKLVTKYIEDYDNISWFNKYRLLIIPSCFVLLNIILFMLFSAKMSLFGSNLFAFILCILFAFISKESSYIEGFINKVDRFILYFGKKLIYLIIDMGLLYLFAKILSYSNIISKIIVDLIILCIAIVVNKIIRNKKM